VAAAWGTRNQRGAVHVMGLRQPRLRGHGGRRTGASYRGGESWRPRPRGHEGQGAGAGYSGWGLGVWSTGGEVAKSAWHGGDQGLRATGWRLARSADNGGLVDFKPSCNVENGSCFCQC